MTDAEIRAALDDRQTLALTGWGEARGIPREDPDDHSPVEELIAVMVVVRNRRATFARWRAADASWKAICLATNQFSCWNPDSGANAAAVLGVAELLVSDLGRKALTSPIPVVDATGAPLIDPLVRECLYLADGVMSGVLVDRTGTANSYWAPRAMQPRGRVPSWAVGLPRLQIGDQFFVSVHERA